MKLSVVVVNWNSREDLAACLASLRRQTHQDLEVVVVDNGSHDGSAQMVREHHPSCLLLAEAKNLGFAEGCNRGIAASSGPWVAMLNNDAVAEPRWAEALVRAAEAAPARCGMLQSLLLFADRPDTVNSTGIQLTRLGAGHDRGEGERRPDEGPLEEIFCPTAGAAAYRRAMLEEVKLSAGYFDRGHFCYYEDLDLGWRARLAGWSAYFVPGSVVLHKYHGSTARKGEAWLVLMSRTNRVRTLLKNASWPFLRATFRHTRDQVRELRRATGARGLARLAVAILTGLWGRLLVSRLAVRERTALEREWVGR